MADNVTMPGTEGIVASSQQQKVALEPTTFYNDPVSERVAAVEPNTIKEATNNKLRNDVAWNAYITNPARMVGSAKPGEDYRKFRQIESMWRKPEFASIIDEYGSDMAVGGQMLADYVDWDKVSWWDKQVIGIRSARYGMKIGEARTKVAQLEHDGADQAQIDAAKEELSRLEKYAVENSRPYESDTANAWASFGVSAGRVVPEMLATSVAIGVAAKTLGAAAPAAGLAVTRLSMTLGNIFGKVGRAANIVRGLKTARALERGSKYTTTAGKLTKELASGGAQAGIIYGDTYRVTMGDLYQRIKDENPGISDERAYEMADTSATIQAAMESAPAFIGLGARAAITTELDTIVKSVLTKTPTDQIRRAAFIKYFQEEFNNGLGKRIAKGWAADTIVDTVTEVAQQASENATIKLAAEGGEGNVTAETFERIAGFIADPFNKEYDDELNTLLSVAPAAAFFGGVAPTIAYAGSKMTKSSVGSKISDAFRSNRFGEQLRTYTQEMTDKVGAETLKEQLRGMASRGDAPGTVRFDAAAIKEAVDTDPELRRAMDRLGVLRQINESQGNGGVIEVPIEEYNEVVNGEKSGVLYQKVKDMVSFRLDAMTMTELNEWIASTEAQNKKEMQEAIANERSVYNRMLNEYFASPEFERMTEGQKKANAALIQLVANRATRSLLSPMTAEEWFEKNVMFVTGEPKGKGLKQKVKYKGKQGDMFNDVFTADGKQIKYAEEESGYNTGVNREAIADDTNIKIVEMSPQQFLNITPKKMGSRDVTELENAIKNGNEIAMPFLNVEVADANNKILRVVQHEGRHRSLAMQNLGVQNGYTILNSKDFYRQPALFADGLKGWKLLPQGETDINKAIELQGDARDKFGGTLQQKDEGKIAGWFNVIDNKYVIGLTENWNSTTFSHEVMHLYSRVMQDNYNNGTLSSYWKAQVEKLFSSVDAKPDANGKYILTDNQNELLAERFTTYLVDNEIKNPELNAIFAVLRAAMRITYAESGRTKHQPDKKTKEAFAVIFGAYDVAVAEQQALGLLEIEKPEGVSQETYDHYMSFLLESRAKATHDMIKTYYAVEKYKKTKGYAKEYDETYTANLQAVEMEPRFKIKALAKQLGTEDVVALLQAYNSVNGNALLTEDDVMAALNDTAEATQVAEARTAEMMETKIREEFKIADGTTLVSKDMKNAAMAKAFLMEALMYEGKDWADFETEYRNLLDSVENEIQKMQLSKLQNSRRWNQLESLYALRYQGFASTGNKEKMAMVRRSQAQVVLIQNKMFEMNNRVDRFLEKFPKKLRTAQPQGQNTMSAESWDLLQSLMEKYGFKITDRRRSTDPFHVKLDNWLKNIEASQYCPISNLRYFLPEVDRGHEGSFGSMTVRQFEVLEHVAIAINSVASREYTLFTESEKARYDALAKLTAERLKEKGIKPFDQNDSWWRKHFGILSNIVNPEPVMKALFPEEVQRMLIRPFFSAAAAAETKFNEWNDMWNDMIKNINLSNTKKQYATGDIISYNNVANLLLAMGNEHSYENWRLFLHLDEAKAEAIVAEALAEQPELAKFANAYWKMMAETTDIMNDSYRKRYNKLFVKKQPRAFKIGEYEFTGGYVPETKLVSELTDDAGWESIVMGELSNEKLLSDKPDGQDLQSIVDHTRSRLRLFARWGHVAPAFNNLVKFAQREDVGLAIGTRAQGYIKGWLRDYHTPAGDSAGLMHALMSATTTTVLGIRFPQALLQLSGFIPAMGILGRGGVRYMVSAIGHTFATGGFHQVAMARDKSEYMKARYSDPVKTLFGVSKAEAHINKAFDKYQKFAMSMISYMDAIVANATWTASYRMAIDDGLSEIEAREKADQNVRLSQTDALSVSRSRAMKSDWARVITPFSTYMMGMQSVVRGRIAEKEYYGAFTFAISYIAVSTFFEAMLKEIPYPWEDDDDKNYIEKVLLRWYNDSVSTAGSTLYPIANLGSYATETFAQSVEKLIDPDEKTWIDMYGYGSLAALSYAKQYPDAVKYGMIGVFNGDEDAQRKAIANFVGWFSAGGKRMVKDLMED